MFPTLHCVHRRKSYRVQSALLVEQLESRAMLAGDVDFAAPVAYQVGSNAVFVAAADINGDQNLDLVTANFLRDDISVLIGTGGGQFAAEVRYPVGDAPFSIVVDDPTSPHAEAMISNLVEDQARVATAAREVIRAYRKREFGLHTRDRAPNGAETARGIVYRGRTKRLGRRVVHQRLKHGLRIVSRDVRLPAVKSTREGGAVTVAIGHRNTRTGPSFRRRGANPC